jgi:hypoxanthine phosphoribosyltransferase
MSEITLKPFTNTPFKDTLGETVISADKIKTAVEDCGKRISEAYRGKPLLMVGMLKGAFVFLSDLVRSVSIPCETDFMRVSSYGDGTEAGKLKIITDLNKDIKSYHVIIVEDIVDTGRTLKSVTKLLKDRSPLSLKVITLIDKPSRREVDYTPDETLFTIPDVFIVGYGLDYAEYGRNLPYIASLKAEIFN